MKDFAKTMVAAVVGGCITFGGFKAFDEPKEKVIIEKTPDSYTRMANLIEKNPDGSLRVDFSYAAEKTTPTVVHIRNTMNSRGNEGRVQSIPPQFRDFFDFFGGGEGGEQLQEMPQQPAQGSGSGVIISNDGYIVTNNHVIDNASELEVTLYDNRTFKAKVIGADPDTDIALVKIDAKDLPKLALGNSDDTKVGQWVLAVGNPFNLNSTVTAGIVSAKGRNRIIGTETAVESFIQTDAAVNPGNSGGALVNLDGELVGINTAIFSQTGTYAGYAFAVPTSIVRKVVEDLTKYGKVQRAYLGVGIQDVSGTLVKEKDLKTNKGVYIPNVTEEGAAQAAGIKAGDVILKVDNKDVNSTSQLQETISMHKPGDKVKVTLNRNGREQIIDVTLKGKSGNTQIARASSNEILQQLGADLSNLTDKEKDELKVKNGVKVAQLYPGLLAETGMKKGFVITKVNKQAIDSTEDLIRAMTNAEGGILIEGVYPGSSKPQYFALGM